MSSSSELRRRLPWVSICVGVILVVTAALGLWAIRPSDHDESALPAILEPSAYADLDAEINAQITKNVRSDKYGLHFDHPNNEKVTDPVYLIPYTNVWAKVEFRGQDSEDNFVKPTVKTAGDIRIIVPENPVKRVEKSLEAPNTTTTSYQWELKVVFGDGVKYYMSLYAAAPDDEMGTLEAQSPGRLTGNAAHRELVIITATDPARPRDKTPGRMPLDWKNFANSDLDHLPPSTWQGV